MNTYLTIFGKPRYIGLMKVNDEKFPITKRPFWSVIQTFRGLEMGLPGGIVTEEQQAKYKITPIRFEEGNEPIVQKVDFIRRARQNDIITFYKNKRLDEYALVTARKVLADHKLTIKLVDVERLLDGKKMYFYFTADQRVDFRPFVRDLARTFRTRIEMRQIGIRDEARVAKGLSVCGRPCCCSYWLRSFCPVSIKIVKEQRSALSPTKISGLCGRLMCCMSYEKEFYSELWEKLPGPGTKIKTEQGIYILEGLEIKHERVNIRFPNGRLVPISIEEFPDFKEAVLNGEEWGEDKELVEKKKAAAERIAMIKEKSGKKKQLIPRLRQDNIDKISETIKQRRKSRQKQSKAVNREGSRKRRRQSKKGKES